MLFTRNRNSYRLRRRPGQQGLLQVVVRNQAGLGGGYWKIKRNIRKQRKWKSKKKTSPTTGNGKDKLQDFNILQVNVCGLEKKKVHLAKIFHEKEVHVALLQETLHSSCDIHITGYTPYPCKCGNCQGIITYIRNDIQGEVELLNWHPTDAHKVTLWYGGSRLILYNIYCPPSSTLNFMEQSTLYRKTVIAGDLNGHSPLWGYTDLDNTGKKIEELCQSTNLVLLQDENSTKTLLHRRHGTLHRPDLTLVSADLKNYCSEEVLECISSDHRPILTKIHQFKRKKRKRRTRWNFKKANWELFRKTADDTINLDNLAVKSIDTINDEFTAAILNAAKKSIPRGCRNHYKPFWNEDLEKATKTKNETRLEYEKDLNNIEKKIKYKKAVAEAKLITKKSKKEAWTEKCEGLNLRQGGHEAWSLLNNLTGDTRKENPKPLHTETETLTSDFKKAEHFNKYFASVNKSGKKSTLDKGLLSVLKEKEKDLMTPSIFHDFLTKGELEKAIKELKKRKSPGPDKVHNEMIQNLGEKAKCLLLNLYNRTWTEGKLPKAWKLATINPILKKGKNAGIPKSYRPISLTSCIGKLCEKILNSRLYWFLESSGLITQFQAGFRSKGRTEDQLFRLTQRIIDGFQKGESTTAVFVDLKQAYDRVWRKGLLLKLQNMGVKGNMYSWIKSFLTDRLIQTQMNDSLSSKSVLEEGLPQGSSISCTLFLVFLNDLPDALKTEIALFADDLVLWHTGNSTIISRRRLQEDLDTLGTFCRFWKLEVNCEKSVYTIFSRSYNLADKEVTLSINGNILKRETNPVYLGVELDCKLNLKQHTNNLRKKAMKRLNLIKRLASTDWGADKNTLRGLYLGYTRAIFDYNLSLQNICNKSSKNSLDTIQNQALRLISGGMRTTPTAACEIHTNIEPLEFRRERAALETYERSKRLESNHPNKILVDKWKPNKKLKKTTSILDTAMDLQEKHHLPERREPLKRVPPNLPPHITTTKPEIKKTLLDKCKKDTYPVALKHSALETIDSYPPTWIHSYTDGSAFKATINAGYGSVMYLPSGDKKEVFNSSGSFCSNFIAEQQAITSTANYINHLFDTNPHITTDIVIFTDSLSTLEKLEGGTDASKDFTHLIWSLHSLISRHHIRVVLQWIPAHTGIPGNERADALAKKGASLPQPDIPTDYNTCCQMIKSNSKEEWMNNWATGKTGRRMYDHMCKPKKQDPINKLRRKDQSIIFQLRTQHLPLNQHLHRIGVKQSAACPLCDYPSETVEHHLFFCRKLTDIRGCYLPKVPHTANCLYTSFEQLEKTCTYYRMALSRRANAHNAAG